MIRRAVELLSLIACALSTLAAFSAMVQAMAARKAADQAKAAALKLTFYDAMTRQAGRQRTAPPRPRSSTEGTEA